jgi:hypothetical protein
LPAVDLPSSTVNINGSDPDPNAALARGRSTQIVECRSLTSSTW